MTMRNNFRTVSRPYIRGVAGFSQWSGKDNHSLVVYSMGRNEAGAWYTNSQKSHKVFISHIG